MPIETNFACSPIIFHYPIPVRGIDAVRFNAVAAVEYKKIRMVVKGGLATLKCDDSFLWEVFDYTKLKDMLAKIIARTGEPWWDFCCLVKDSEPQSNKNAHALQLMRITKHGRVRYLAIE